MKKATIFFLAAASILMVLAGCATVKKTLAYFGFGGSAEQRYAITNRQVSEFASRIRPARGNPDSHYLLACYYQERGRYREALEEFKKVVAIDPEHANAYNGMGIAYDRLMDHSRAVEAYQLALKLNPSLDYVFNNLGYSYLLQGNYESAIHSFENAVALNGGNSRMHNNLGMVLGLNQQFDRALEEFELAGDKARAHYNLAQIYFQHGMIDEARSSFCDALIRNPAYASAQKGLDTCDVIVLAREKALKAQVQLAVQSADEAMQENGLRAERAIDTKEARIEISNGNGVRYMARNVGQYLEKKGFSVVRLTNADHFKHGRAGIYYQEEYLDIALLVAEEIPGVQKLSPMSNRGRPDIHVKVLVGKDLVPHKKLFAGGRS